MEVFLPRVHELVPLVGVGGGELLVADVALEWLGVSVVPLVDSEGRRGGEGSQAHSALVGLLACVGSAVGRQVGRVGKGFLADVAHKWSFTYIKKNENQEREGWMGNQSHNRKLMTRLLHQDVSGDCAATSIKDRA